MVCIKSNYNIINYNKFNNLSTVLYCALTKRSIVENKSTTRHMTHDILLTNFENGFTPRYRGSMIRSRSDRNVRI